MENDIVVICGFSSCVDGDTEYFNGKGWKKISEYIDGDKVLQFNNNGVSELVAPIKYHINDESKLYNFKNRFIDMSLTDSHDIVYNTKNENFKKVKVYDFLKEYKNNNGYNNKIIPTHHTYTFEGSINLSEFEIRLMVAIIADGSFESNTNNRCHLNFKKQYKIDRLEYLLSNTNIKYTKVKYEDGYTRFKFHAPIKTKKFDSIWYNISRYQANIILDEIFRWDGDNNSIYRTTIKESADYIQFLLSATNSNAFIETRIRYNEPHGKYIKNHTEYIVKKTKIKTVSTRTKYNNTLISESFGKSYCFTVPSGMLVLRRNTRIFITGNCGKDSLSRLLEEKLGYNFVISTTTRPIRNYESEGNPYYFLTMNENFEEMIANNEFIEYRTYNTLFEGKPATYYYGVEKSEIDDNKKYVVVLDSHGLNEFKKYFGNRVKSFFIDVNNEERERRAKLRGSFDKIEWDRRLEEDMRIFSLESFKSNIDYEVNNEDTIEICYNNIIKLIKGDANG